MPPEENHVARNSLLFLAILVVVGLVAGLLLLQADKNLLWNEGQQGSVEEAARKIALLTPPGEGATLQEREAYLVKIEGVAQEGVLSVAANCSVSPEVIAVPINKQLEVRNDSPDHHTLIFAHTTLEVASGETVQVPAGQFADSYGIYTFRCADVEYPAGAVFVTVEASE